MKRRIYLIFLLVLFFFVFDRGSSLLFRELHYSFYAKINMKKNPLGKMKVIKKGYYDAMIFGSSRTYWGILPVYLLKYLGIRAYTEAKPDRYSHYFYLFYTNFKKMFGRPKYVFYGMDYFMFKLRTRRAAIKLVSKNTKKRKGLSFNKVLKNKSWSTLIFSRLYSMKRLIDETAGDFLEFLSVEMDSGKGKTFNANAMRLFYGKKGSIKPKFRNKPKKWKKHLYVNSENGEGKFLKMLLNELEADGVTVFLVVIPDYIGSYMSQIEKDLFLEDLKMLIKGKRNIYILNYNDPEIFDLSNPELFIDGNYGQENSHLSNKGCLPLNRLLAEDFEKIINDAGAKN